MNNVDKIEIESNQKIINDLKTELTIVFPILKHCFMQFFEITINLCT